MTDDEVSEVTKLMGRLLIARRDVKAVEKVHGLWIPDRTKFTKQDFVQHLTGNRCLGTYLLDSDNNVRFFAFDVDLSDECQYFALKDMTEIDDQEYGADAELDIDDTRHGNLESALHDPVHDGHLWARVLLRCTLDSIANAVTTVLDLVPLVVVTGGGGHVLVPVPNLTPATDARAMAAPVMEHLGYSRLNEVFWSAGGNAVSIEVFPKQDTIRNQGGLGNLIRLPLGVHSQTGKRSFFMNYRSNITPGWVLPVIDPLSALKIVAEALGLAV